MPTLLQINVASNKGSTGKIAENIGLTALSNGWDSYIVHSKRYAGKTKLKDISGCNSFSEFVHYIISLVFDAHGMASYFLTRKLIKKIEKIKPDIVHLHNIHGYYINFKLLFESLLKLDVPVVWTLHDCWPFTGHCVYFDRVNCQKWKVECQHCPQCTSYPRALFDFSKRNFKLKMKVFNQLDNLTIVPVSNWLSNLVSHSYLCDFPRKVIHNGIDLNLFKPTETNLRQRYNLVGKKIILGVADGFGARKGLDDFIKLSKLLSDEYQIVLIGVTSSDLSKIPGSILAIERTSDQLQLAEFYSIAEVYLNLTYEDNFPTTNIEALACGTPVITYDTGGSIEAISEDTGIIVQKNDIKSLYDSVMYFSNIDRSTLREKCRRRALDNYDMNLKFQEYMSLYSNLISK